MKRIIAQARKELTQTFRDRLTLALALALPLAQMWLIGQAVSLSVTDLGVVVQRHGSVAAVAPLRGGPARVADVPRRAARSRRAPRESA